MTSLDHRCIVQGRAWRPGSCFTQHCSLRQLRLYSVVEGDQFMSIVLRLGMILLFVVGLGVSRPAQAATITVTTTSDELNADGDCSLREAIRAANSNTQVDTCPVGTSTDVINVPAGTYLLTIAGRDEDAAASGDLDLLGDITLNGAGVAATIIDGNQLDR